MPGAEPTLTPTAPDRVLSARAADHHAPRHTAVGPGGTTVTHQPF
jgi:hypothetical protein